MSPPPAAAAGLRPTAPIGRRSGSPPRSHPTGCSSVPRSAASWRRAHARAAKLPHPGRLPLATTSTSAALLTEPTSTTPRARESALRRALPDRGRHAGRRRQAGSRIVRPARHVARPHRRTASHLTETRTPPAGRTTAHRRHIHSDETPERPGRRILAEHPFDPRRVDPAADRSRASNHTSRSGVYAARAACQPKRQAAEDAPTRDAATRPASSSEPRNPSAARAQCGCRGSAQRERVIRR